MGEYHRLFEYFASELEQVPEPVELKFHVIVEFDEAMCILDDDRLIYMVKQALENNSIDIYRGFKINHFFFYLRKRIMEQNVIDIKLPYM